MRVTLILAAGVLALASAVAGSPATNGEAPATRSPLPEGVGEILAAEFPGLTVPTRGAFVPQLPLALGGADPARAEGDFNGDGRGDLALILSGGDEHRVVVLLGQERGAWQVQVLDRRPGPITAGARSYVAALPPGERLPSPGDEVASGAPGPTLHHEALETGTLGRSAAVTHWAGDRPVTHPRPPRLAGDEGESSR